MSRSAEKVFEKAENESVDIRSHIRNGAEWFHENEGEMFQRSEARKLLKENLGVRKRTSARIITELVGDNVDPIVQAEAGGEKYVGVAEFKGFEGCYGYVDYDDIEGRVKKVVCQQCVNQAENDSKIFNVVTENKENNSYQEMIELVNNHYEKAHDKKPETIETGATLASGTTIAGNISWHAGNDGDGSGLDADTVDGIEAADIGVLEADVGYFNDGDTSITTGFEPVYIEVVAQIHQNNFGAQNNPNGAPLGQSHGFATGSSTADQVVVVEGDGSASVNGHSSYVGEGDVIYSIQTSNDGDTVSNKSVASVSSFDSDGFTLNWNTTGSAAYYIYKAFG